MCRNQKDHQESRCCVPRRNKEIKSVHDNKLPSKEGEHVIVDEVVNDDELVKDANPISLKERATKDVEGDEFTSNSSSKEDFVTSQYEGLNKPQQDG